MHFIERKIKPKILKYIDNFPVIGIIGPRQVGKTSLIKSIAKQLPKESIYLDLEMQTDLDKLQDAEFYLKQHSDKTVIIDEIQRKKELFPLLRALVDINIEPGRFIILGSASPDMIRDSSETLAGRIVYVELYPINFLEVNDKFSLQKHWFRGGFPVPLLTEDSEVRNVWIENFISTYVERDLPLLGLSASPAIIRKLWTMLAHFQGGIWNASKFSNALGITVPTVKRYFNFLEDAYLINVLQPYHANVKKRLVKSPKVYIRDTGILHRLLNIESFNELQEKVIVGASWEGYAIEQIRQSVNKNYKLYYYRTHRGTECDLIITKSEKPVATVEIKYSASGSITKSQTITIKDLRTKSNFIITSNSDDYLLREDMRICTLEKFLKYYLPKSQ